MGYILKGGTVVDGTGRSMYQADIKIENGLIAAMGADIDTKGDVIKDVTGKYITPGFIDTHTHSDLRLLEQPYLAPKLRQGITTELLGQDGVAMAPLPKAYIEDWRKNISGLDGESDCVDWGYETSENYLRMLEEKGVCSNVAYLVPHGNVRLEVMGMSGEEATDEQIGKMKEVLHREMKSGAVGFSTGLIYIPCAYANTKEVKELCKVVAEYDGIFVVHQRSEADDILSSMDEIIEIARDSGVKLHISHFKLCGKKNTDKLVPLLKKIDRVKEEGIEVSFDMYPYTAGSTTLSVLLPPWVHVGGTHKMLERLQDERVIARIREDVEKGIEGWDNFIDFAGYDGIYITNVTNESNRNIVGKNLEEIAGLRGIDPLLVMIQILIEEENKVSMIDFYGKEEHLQAFMQRKEQNFCTDGILHGQMHPRTYGAFARVLRKYVKEEGVLTFEEAIYKLSGKPANVLGLVERGTLEVGKAADILVIDPDTVRDCATYQEPRQFAQGIDTVFVNGEKVFDEGKEYITKSGKILRKKGDKDEL